MKRTSTTTLLATLVVILSFGILYGASSGLFKAPEGLLSQNVQGIFGLLMLIVGYYFGATHKQNEPQNPKPNMNPQVFWNIQNLDDLIDGTSDPVKTLKDTDPNYNILLDDTNIPVLVVNTSTPVSLTLVGASGTYTATSSVSSFASGRPVRPR